MFNPSEQGSAFGRRLLRAQSEAGQEVDPLVTADLQQWLDYWNDAETIGTNLRKFEHWLQRARTQQGQA